MFSGTMFLSIRKSRKDTEQPIINQPAVSACWFQTGEKFIGNRSKNQTGNLGINSSSAGADSS